MRPPVAQELLYGNNMNKKFKIKFHSFGWSGTYYRPVAALTQSIDVWVAYPSNIERRYSFDNDAKACAFVGRTLTKHPLAKCTIHIPCQSGPHDFGLYPNHGPEPSIKSISLSISCNNYNPQPE